MKTAITVLAIASLFALAGCENKAVTTAGTPAASATPPQSATPAATNPPASAEQATRDTKSPIVDRVEAIYDEMDATVSNMALWGKKDDVAQIDAAKKANALEKRAEELIGNEPAFAQCKFATAMHVRTIQNMGDHRRSLDGRGRPFQDPHYIFSPMREAVDLGQALARCKAEIEAAS